MPFKQRSDPAEAWAIPFVTNNRYKIHWKEGVDFTSMQIRRSVVWTDADKSIIFSHNNTDRRDVFNFTLSDGSYIENDTVSSATPV